MKEVTRHIQEHGKALENFLDFLMDSTDAQGRLLE